VIWLSWRQQRAETVIAGALLVLLVVLVLPSGLGLASFYHHNGIAACRASGTLTCQAKLAGLDGHAGFVRGFLPWFTLVPGLIGVALAAPTVFDLEDGGVVFGWTQGLTRRHWVGVKLAVALASALAATGLLTVLLTWYRQPLDAVHGRLDNSVFDVEWIVPLAYATFALGLGLAIGVVWKRAVPAFVLAFVAYVASRLFVDTWLRERLVAPRRAVWPFDQIGPALDRAWIITAGPSDRFGHSLTKFDLVQRCAGPAASKQAITSCLARQGVYNHAVYQPAGRFWLFQGIEFALFAGIGVALIGFAAWWLLRAD
jgi:hypothetical protein